MLALLEEEKAEILPLIDAAVLGSADRFRLERQETDLTSRADLARAKKAQVNEGLALIDIEIDAIDKQYLEAAKSERSDAIARLARIEAQLPAFQQKLEVTEIKAPVDGVVNQLYINSAGTVLRQGDRIAEIVPALDRLVVEAFVDPKDIGQIEPGQKARISLTAYDPTIWVTLMGHCARYLLMRCIKRKPEPSCTPRRSKSKRNLKTLMVQL